MSQTKMKNLLKLLKEFSALVKPDQPMAAMAIDTVCRMVECYVE